MKITIETIPHGDQRYPTAGDWVWIAPGELSIRVSDMGNVRYEAAIGLHELVEAILCYDAQIPQEAVDTFDALHAKELRAGEPGDDPGAPYREQHCFATAVERMLIAALGVPWAEYDAAVEALL